jgi:hypothetical protein
VVLSPADNATIIISRKTAKMVSICRKPPGRKAMHFQKQYRLQRGQFLNLLDWTIRMSAIRHNSHAIAIIGAVLMLLSLFACSPLPTATPLAAERAVVTVAKTDKCEACDQATLAAAIVQEQNASDIQAVATAEIVRANAQATLNSASATLIAVQTQEQNNSNAIAAQIASTAEIEHANAKATLVAAGSTQSAALTQDVILQTQVEYNLQVNAAMATQNALAVAKQQQIEKQRQAPIMFLWMWCLPIFILLLAGLVLWGVWRWLKINQANQQNLENTFEKQQAPKVENLNHQQADSLPYRNRGVNRRSRFTESEDDHALRWLDEVRRKLLGRYKKDDYDNSDY